MMNLLSSLRNAALVLIKRPLFCVSQITVKTSTRVSDFLGIAADL